MAKKKDGCASPAGGPIMSGEGAAPAAADSSQPEEAKMQAHVGQIAPDFEATAFNPESGDFINVKLSDYKGKWITLCFYPGDFTFV